MFTTTTTADPETHERVWISYGGQRFHTTPDCSALAEGQEKARAAGHQPWRVVSTSRERARGRSACLVCRTRRPATSWTDTDDRILRIALDKGRPVSLIAGMLQRTEDQINARIQALIGGEHK